MDKIVCVWMNARGFFMLDTEIDNSIYVWFENHLPGIVFLTVWNQYKTVWFREYLRNFSMEIFPWWFRILFQWYSTWFCDNFSLLNDLIEQLNNWTQKLRIHFYFARFENFKKVEIEKVNDWIAGYNATHKHFVNQITCINNSMPVSMYAHLSRNLSRK